MTGKPAQRLELVKVIVQPVFIERNEDGVIDGEAADQITVSAAEWPTFHESWADRHAEYERKLTEG